MKLSQMVDVVEIVGVIVSILFGVINLILYLCDKREARKPILYVVSQKNETTIKVESNVHIYGCFGINLGVVIYNIGNRLARNIKIQWIYEGRRLDEPTCIMYILAK